MTRHRLLAHLVCLACVAASLCSAPASAQAPPVATDPAEVAALTRDYDRAQELFKQGDCEQALPIFRRVVDGLGSPNARLYVARCLQQRGQHAEAHRQMQMTRDEAAERVATEPRYADTRDVAERELHDLAALVSLVRLVPAAPYDDLAIEVDGERLDPRWVGRDVAVSPGLLVLRAEARGRDALRRELDVAAGEHYVVDLSLAAPVVLPAPGPSPAPPPAPPSSPAPSPTPEPPTGPAPAPIDDPAPADTTKSPAERLTTWGIVSFGVGAFGFATFAVAGTMANNRYDDVLDKCGGTRCTDPSYDSQIREGRVMDIVANGGAGLGAIGVTVGIILLAVDAAQPGPAPAGAALVTPVLAPDFAGVGAAARF